LVEAYLQRIQKIDSQVHSYIHVAADGARQAALAAGREIARGRRRSALHGIPFAVKDNYDAAGMPATAGSRMRIDHIPETDATLIADLKQVGGVLLGKLSTWEYGTGNGGEYFDLPFPPARNPWNLDHHVRWGHG
jgi:aspartyl-tRNA(Asn)/glutamyl-tRNA(Gln) amidotransferase subunit A